MYQKTIKIFINNFFIIFLIPLLIFLISLFLPLSYQRITVLFLIYACLSICWIAVFKMGYVSLGTAAFYGMGAYMFVYLTKYLPQLSYHIDLFLPIPAIAIISSLIGYVTMKLRGIFFIFATFALAETLRHIFIYLEITYTGHIGKVVSNYLSTSDALAIFSFLLFFCLLLYKITEIPKYKLILSYIKEDEILAKVAGIYTLKYKILFFTLASVLQGVVGSVSAWHLSYIDPHLVFNPTISIQVLIIGLLGGASHILGPILASVLVVYVSEQIIRIAPFFYLIIFGLIIIVVSLLLKGGFSDLIIKLKKNLYSKKN